MELKYTPRKIAAVEKQTGRPITETLGVFSMGTCALMVGAGLGINEDAAYTEIDKYFEAGGDMVELYLMIMESLQKDGFLPKALNIQEVRAKMQKIAI